MNASAPSSTPTEVGRTRSQSAPATVSTLLEDDSAPLPLPEVGDDYLPVSAAPPSSLPVVGANNVAVGPPNPWNKMKKKFRVSFRSGRPAQ